MLCLSLSACSDKKSLASAEPKVGVKVNGQAISVAELDVKSGHNAGTKQHAVSEPKMQQIVDMELMHQAAVQSKLDADEHVVARIAASTRTILAMAYMEKLLAAVADPTDADISNYYNQNPARFVERKEYRIQEFSIQPPPGKAAEIQGQSAKSRNAQAFDQWLTGNNIPHESTPVSVTSDRLPDDALQKLKNVPVGGAVVLGNDGQMNVLVVLAEKPQQPIALAQARRSISNMLLEKRKKEALDGGLKQLRDKAKIEYVPPYTAKGLPASVEMK